MTRVEIPTRDVERRKLFGTMLNLPKSAWGRLTTEEMERICLERGYLEEVKQ